MTTSYYVGQISDLPVPGASGSQDPFHRERGKMPTFREDSAGVWTFRAAFREGSNRQIRDLPHVRVPHNLSSSFGEAPAFKRQL